MIDLPDSSVVGSANSFRMTIQTEGLNLANARYFVSSAFATRLMRGNIRGRLMLPDSSVVGGANSFRMTKKGRLRRAPTAEGCCGRPDFPEGRPVHDGVHPDIVP